MVDHAEVLLNGEGDAVLEEELLQLLV